MNTVTYFIAIHIPVIEEWANIPDWCNSKRTEYYNRWDF